MKILKLIFYVVCIWMLSINFCSPVFADGPSLYAGSQHQWPTGYIKAVKLVFTPDDIPGLNEVFQELGISREEKTFIVNVSEQAVTQAFKNHPTRPDESWYFEVKYLEDEDLPPGPYSVKAAWTEIDPENEHGWSTVWSDFSPPLVFTKPGSVPAPSGSIGNFAPGT